MNKYDIKPTTEKQRFIILDALRGFALFTIILANFPEFGLWTFLSSETHQAMPTAAVDSITRYMQYFLIDGKGYTIFSLLFGCGFSIILEHAFQRGASGISLFYRRMTILLLIALCHLLFVWSGDILCLYAVLGMILPLFHKLSNKGLLWSAGVLLFIPVALDFVQQLFGLSFAAPLWDAWWATAVRVGINEGNFATWLRDADNYSAMFQFLMQGAVERMWEFVDGNRVFKVLGLFVLGYAIGRNRLYARLEDFRPQMVRICKWSSLIGIPTSLLYAWHAVSGHPWGAAMHSMLYFISVVPMAFFYITAICLLYLHCPAYIAFRIFAKPGRMALTNYISQSVIGVMIYYGIGFSLGLTQGLYQIELTAIAVFALQILFSWLWMEGMKYGPLEWVWRMMTYGRWLNPKK
uniref:DUF418 domain-containing protein n=1 Tax=Prevotella sp. GTC17262 TaxID=3236797 RepID=A0AB33JG43_9BACT